MRGPHEAQGQPGWLLEDATASYETPGRMRTESKTELTVMLCEGGCPFSALLVEMWGEGAGFGGTGQQQELLCIPGGHKAAPEDIPSCSDRL